MVLSSTASADGSRDQKSRERDVAPPLPFASAHGATEKVDRVSARGEGGGRVGNYMTFHGFAPAEAGGSHHKHGVGLDAHVRRVIGDMSVQSAGVYFPFG